ARTEFRATVADDDHVTGNARRAGDGVRTLGIGGEHFPDQFTSLRVECLKASVDNADKDLAVVHRNAAIDDVTAGLPAHAAVHLWIVVPQQLAGSRIKRKHAAPWAGGVKDAVHHQWCCLMVAYHAGAEAPGETKPADVVCIDVGERAVTRFTVVEAVAEPFHIRQCAWRAG